jgi:hypothetical protein
MKSGFKAAVVLASIAAFAMSVSPKPAHAQLWDGGIDLWDGGTQLGAAFTTKHKTVGNTCTYTEYWYLFKGFKYLGSSAMANVEFMRSTTQYASADAFKKAMSGKGGRLAVATVVEEGACTSGILIDGSDSDH